MLIQAGEDNSGCRALAQVGRDPFDITRLLKGKLCFTVMAKLDFMPELYTRMDDFLYGPVVFRQYLNKIGNTSLEVIKELHCEKGELFVNFAAFLGETLRSDLI